MIFVTVGEQLPFDRLVRSVDDWAGTTEEHVVAQIGNTEFTPQNMEYKSYFTPAAYKEYIRTTDCIIAHAGMGSIITAIDLQKPIIILPRQQSLGEHRTDHQFATAEKFRKYPSVIVATDTLSLQGKLAEMACIKKLSERILSTEPDPALINALRKFIR